MISVCVCFVTHGYKNVEQILQSWELWNELLHHFTECLEDGVIIDARQVEAETRAKPTEGFPVKTLPNDSHFQFWSFWGEFISEGMSDAYLFYRDVHEMTSIHKSGERKIGGKLA